MKLYQKITKSLLLVTAPIIASITLPASPTIAATFASSEASANLFGFNTSALGTSTSAKANALTSTGNLFDLDEDPFASGVGLENEDGSVTASAQADASFISGDNPFAGNTSRSEVVGIGESYFGQGKSEASVVGNFFVDSGSFSFDFNADFSLSTSIEKPFRERAKAKANISFMLFGSSDPNPETFRLLDSLSLSGNLKTVGNDSFSAKQKNNNFSFSFLEVNDLFVGENLTDEFASVFALGSYSRSFSNPTYLKLVEVKQTKAFGAVPEPFEPSVVFSLLLTSVSIVVRSKMKGKTF